MYTTSDFPNLTKFLDKEKQLRTDLELERLEAQKRRQEKCNVISNICRSLLQYQNDFLLECQEYPFVDFNISSLNGLITLNQPHYIYKLKFGPFKVLNNSAKYIIFGYHFPSGNENNEEFFMLINNGKDFLKYFNINIEFTCYLGKTQEESFAKSLKETIEYLFMTEE